MNKALALNCSAPLNTTKGARAENWKKGIPVRVVRSCKLRKHSDYAPKAGNRYDGIYKVVEYFPQKGKSGFSVWRYLLRRDDPSPAPWTIEGQKRMEALGLKMITYKSVDEVTEKVTEATKAESKVKAEKKDNKSVAKTKKKRGKVVSEESVKEELEVKKPKRESYELDDETAAFVKEDVANSKLWEECCRTLVDGKIIFLQTVAERYVNFICVMGLYTATLF